MSLATQYMQPNGYGGSPNLLNWTANGASTGWECLDEWPDDGDTTYIQSDGTKVPSILTKMTLQPPPYGAPTGDELNDLHRITLRMKRVRTTGTAVNPTIAFALYQGNGTTLVATSSWSLGTGTSSYVGRNYDLTSGEISTITDYDDLHLWIQQSGGSGYDVHVSSARFLIPTASGPQGAHLGHFA